MRAIVRGYRQQGWPAVECERGVFVTVNQRLMASLYVQIKRYLVRVWALRLG